MNNTSHTLPAPRQGLTVTFNYLWAADNARGDIEARKARPCIIVAVADPPNGPNGIKVVGVVPITHSVPAGAVLALPVADRHRRAMGLDDEPCWVILW